MDLCVRRYRDRVNPLLEKLRAGTYRAPRKRRPGSRKKETTKRDPGTWVPQAIAHLVPADACRPTGFAWMNRLLQDHARPGAHMYTGPMSAGFLIDILHQDQEIQEFAKTCPESACALCPLCQMLGIRQGLVPDDLKLLRAAQAAPEKTHARKTGNIRPHQIRHAHRPDLRRAPQTLRQKTSKW